jgi:preprotein translocase subunit SecG
MIAILVFAFGILGLIGMLAGSLRASNDARYRAEAINLANAIVGDMWTTQAADLDTQFGTGGAKLTPEGDGAILVSGNGAVPMLSKVLGTIAVMFATINIVAGFLITDRMLKMFKRDEPKAKTPTESK